MHCFPVNVYWIYRAEHGCDFFGVVVFVTAWSWPQGSDVVYHDIYGKIKLYWVAKHFLLYWVGFEFILIL